MSRKGVFSHLSEPNQTGPAIPARPLTKPKSMASVTRSLSDLSSRGQLADELERKLAEGQVVVELDPGSIEPSFIQDRMEGDNSGLIESIRTQGQQVPILVRPHPDDESRYQVAFGHRRLSALKELGMPIKAVVRKLTDEQLVIAQGQENNEREDLTFIEKARFAQRLHKQFTRDVITSSMSLHRSALSRMLTIVDALPAELIDAIGRAPGIGMRNWQDLVSLFDKTAEKDGLFSFASSPDIQALPSADRFKAVLALKARRPVRSLPSIMSSIDGERLAEVAQNKIKLELTIDKRKTPGFAEFVLNELPGLYAQHMAKQKHQTGD